VRVMGFGLYESTVIFRFCLRYSLMARVVKRACVHDTRAER